MAVEVVEAFMPGIFYRKGNPDDPPYKEEGDMVVAGDTVGLIEIMKSFAPVETGIAGRLVRFLVESEDTVDAGQAICEIET
ncbi:acetyl-CoA carboxylase [Gemmobacter fulvus]|uniref:acetyl-CoA carboxylase n=1 Tax=Gemmobacter fulvus TaxID=2840474 RepID=UPI0027969804|nr:acetyl-CoA carboxylase [Gemmobacter fulvus]MDQ1850621.1 acetyl-CoA carboxylase [Gemmobacter fulvus]